jgi:hypothetical protein
VDAVQVFVYVFSIKDRHWAALPTNVCSASASNVIAALQLLDANFARWTGLDVVLSGPHVIETILFSRIAMDPIFFASHPLMRVCVAARTNARKTGGTVDNCGCGCCSIYLTAIRGRAVFQLLRMLFEIAPEGNIKKMLKLGQRKMALDCGNGNEHPAFPPISNARQWKEFGVGSGGKEMSDAAGAVCVSTIQLNGMRDFVATHRTHNSGLCGGIINEAS